MSPPSTARMQVARTIPTTNTDIQDSKDKLSCVGSGALRCIGEYLPPNDKARFFLWTNRTFRNLAHNSRDEQGRVEPGLIPVWIYHDVRSLGYKGDGIRFTEGLTECTFREIKKKILEAVLTISPTSSQPPKSCILEMFNSKKDPSYARRMKAIATREGILRDLELREFGKSHFPIELSFAAVKAMKEKDSIDQMNVELASRSDIPIEQAISIAKTLPPARMSGVFGEIVKRPDISLAQKQEIINQVNRSLDARQRNGFFEIFVAKIPVDHALEFVRSVSLDVPVKRVLLTRIAERPDIPIHKALETVNIISYMGSSKGLDWDDLHLRIAIRSDIPLDEALKISKVISDIGIKNRALEKILERPDISVEQAFEIVRTTSETKDKDCFLEKILERPDISIEQAFEVIKTISNTGIKIRGLEKIMGRPDISVKQAFEVIKTISEEENRNRVLKKLAMNQNISIEQAFKIVQAIGHQDSKNEAIGVIANRPGIPVAQALEIACKISDGFQRQGAVKGIAKRSDISIAEALRVIDVLSDLKEDRFDNHSFLNEARTEIACRADISIPGALELASRISDKTFKRRVFASIAERKDAPPAQALELARQAIKLWEESERSGKFW